MNEYPESEKLAYEKDVVGLYLSGHPMAAYQDFIDRYCTFDMREFREAVSQERTESLNDDAQVIMCGMLLHKRIRTTKSKTAMAVLLAEDMYGQFEAALFGKVFDQYASVLDTDKPYVFLGRRRIQGEDTFSLSIDAIFPMPQTQQEVYEVTGNWLFKKIFNASAGPKKTVTFTPQSAPATCNDKPGGLVIRFNGDPSGSAYQRLLNLLVYFHGNTPVSIMFKDGSIAPLDPVCNVDASADVMQKLYEACGGDNVQFS
ncbi:MAG: hypothetical protein IKP14_11935 [Clostridiales bacterium]|nr:hypothetical protein [Clostridiales bacterium]